MSERNKLQIAPLTPGLASTLREAIAAYREAWALLLDLSRGGGPGVAACELNTSGDPELRAALIVAAEAARRRIVQVAQELRDRAEGGDRG